MVTLEGLHGRGIELIAADNPGSFLDDTPTAKLVRQVLGAISEFDKAMVVEPGGYDHRIVLERIEDNGGRPLIVWFLSRPLSFLQTISSLRSQIPHLFLADILAEALNLLYRRTSRRACR